jgi:hypothetical protein
MANNNNGVKRTHVSPGIYYSETDLTYASKSLGITTLGVAGETLKGPAFQPILIEDWAQFQTYFGGTSTEKFKGSQYPKYELPYIAKEYLKQSRQLQVCRVLGLSGVNAGDAWLICAYKYGDNNATYTKSKPLVIAVLRSRGEHEKATAIGNDTCGNPSYKYDGINYYAEEVYITESASLTFNYGCDSEAKIVNGSLSINVNDFGTFTLAVKTSSGSHKHYPVSFNPNVKNYITNVIGTNPEVGDTEIYVEELYDVALAQLINEGKIDTIYCGNEAKITDDTSTTDDDEKVHYELPKYKRAYIVPEFEEVDDILTDDESMLSRKKVGKRYLAEDNEKTVHVTNDNGVTWNSQKSEVGHIYTVVAKTLSDGTRTYYYGEYKTEVASTEALDDKGNLKDGYTSENETKYYATKTEVSSEVALDEKGGLKDGYTSETETKYYVTETKTEVASTEALDDKGNLKDGYTSENETKYYATKTEVSSEVALDEKDGLKDGYTSETETKYYAKDNEALTKGSIDKNNRFTQAVYVKSYASYFILKDNKVDMVTLDFNNYKEAYRYASTPWIVSEMKGSANHVELNKLFRFNTISDGAASNTEFKISIENIDPEYGTFDVLVRDFYDTDDSKSVLEKYKSCTLVPGDDNYIAYLIGSTNDDYETKSKYITVEVNENDNTKQSIPAGFLGYPVRNYSGTAVDTENAFTPQQPYFKYNQNVDSDLRITKQYFGVSDIVGIDEDVFSYKGVEAYNEEPNGLTPCFHLDSRIFSGTPNENGVITLNEIEQTVTVDGVKGYSWATVGAGNTVGNFDEEPRLGDVDTMVNTIYEDKRYRKFTVAFYGGFDGWDYYRTYRSNTDDFKYQKYRGNINTVSGQGDSFAMLKEPELYNFDRSEKIINSDYYAYLSAIREFANPKTIDINVLATPGIDYVNNNLLVNEVVEMVEDERADSVYVITTPDKPFGASDSISEMYSPSDAVDNLDDSNLDSNYSCTFYPWVKYNDATNNQYIYLPATKDIVRNFALTDNTAYPWFAAAGWNRGNINGVKPKRVLKLGEQDELYAGRINFVNSFPQDGDRLWGDKNLQIKESQLNRISKRRLLIRIRKLISIACIGLIFDPNDNSTATTFRKSVDPILADIVSKRGLYDYRIVVDDSQEARDRLELNAKLYLKLLPNLEYININMVITPSGVSFDDI